MQRSETESAEARRAIAKQQNLGGRAMACLHTCRARDISTYCGARWAVARELPALASNTRVSGRALTSNTRERAVEHSRVTCERGVEHSRVTHERGVEHSRALDRNARVTALALASVSRRTRE